MASSRRDLFEGQGLKMDMSPMIDMVFLLLVFFMTSSTMITYKKDKRVLIPVASDAQVPKLIEGRVIINVYQDGTARDETGQAVLTEELITGMMVAARNRNPRTRLHLRADKRVPHEFVKKVIAASARGGVTNVIFSTYVTER